MRNSIVLAGAFALALTGSSASETFDWALVEDAPSPSLTGPALDVASQTGVYDQASAIAAALAGAAPDDSGLARRGNGHGNPWEDDDCDYPTRRHTRTTTVHTTITASDCETTTHPWHWPTTTTHHHHRPTTTTHHHYPTTTTHHRHTTTTHHHHTTHTVPSTCTPISWTNTNSFITEPSCPTPFEVGTYCGFINPEDPCAPQPDGYGPHVHPDTVEAFENYPEFKADAENAVAPSGYVETFQNLNASVNANSYLGYITLQSYDVDQCASFCDNTDLCTGFNIYIERDPSINPGQCSCTNPPSITNYKCSIWGSGVDAEAATNFGQSRDDFQVVITASNGYEKGLMAPMTVATDWTNPQNCSAAHSHPDTCIGQKFFPGPFDVDVCAAFADAQNHANGWGKCSNGHGHGPKCNFFNAYMLLENGIPKGTYCSLFSHQYPPSDAHFTPGWHNGDHWGVGSSWSYCLDN